MPDPFNIVLSSFDIPEPCFSSAEVGTWPGPDVDALAKLDVLRDGGTATHISCSACGDGHVEEVQRIGDDQRARFFIICPTAGRVRVGARWGARWTRTFRGRRLHLGLTRGPFHNLHNLLTQRIGRRESCVSKIAPRPEAESASRCTLVPNWEQVRCF